MTSITASTSSEKKNAIQVSAPSDATVAATTSVNASSGSKESTSHSSDRYIDKIEKAINEINDRKGATKQGIVKLILAQLDGKNPEHVKNSITRSLKRGQESGQIIRVEGSGASGRFRVKKETAATKKKEVVVAKKKPAAAILKPKNPSASKASSDTDIKAAKKPVVVEKSSEENVEKKKQTKRTGPTMVNKKPVATKAVGVTKKKQVVPAAASAVVTKAPASQRESGKRVVHAPVQLNPIPVDPKISAKTPAKVPDVKKVPDVVVAAKKESASAGKKMPATAAKNSTPASK